MSVPAIPFGMGPASTHTEPPGSCVAGEGAVLPPIRDQVVPPSDVDIRSDWPRADAHTLGVRKWLPHCTTPQPTFDDAKLASHGNTDVPSALIVRQCAPPSSVVWICSVPFGIVNQVV